MNVVYLKYIKVYVSLYWVLRQSLQRSQRMIEHILDIPRFLTATSSKWSTTWSGPLGQAWTQLTILYWPTGNFNMSLNTWKWPGDGAPTAYHSSKLSNLSPSKSTPRNGEATLAQGNADEMLGKLELLVSQIKVTIFGTNEHHERPQWLQWLQWITMACYSILILLWSLFFVLSCS